MSGIQRRGRLNDGRAALPDSKVLASVISGIGQDTTLIPRNELPPQQIAPSLWILQCQALNKEKIPAREELNVFVCRSCLCCDLCEHVAQAGADS